jgi:hypothetical protein
MAFAGDETLRAKINADRNITEHVSISLYVGRDSSVGIATRLWAEGSWFYGSIPGGGWEFFSSPPRPEWLWGP